MADDEAFIAEFEARPDPAAMTGSERADELLALLGAPDTVDLVGIARVWQRVDALVGRATHMPELATPEVLAAEARTDLTHR